MKIILIRHAKVLLDKTQKITASQMNTWVEAYNCAAVDMTLPKQDVMHWLLGKANKAYLSAILTQR